MTRELKLAIIVGFALILFVGILISDHFSTARHQRSADLTNPQEPLDTSRWENPELLTLNTGESAAATSAEAPAPVVEFGASAAALTPRESVEAIVIESHPDKFRLVDPAPTTASLDVFHDVRRGESLTAICRQYYGDPSRVKDLARYNELANPDEVEVGRRLRIPAAAQLGRGGPSLPSHTVPPATLPTYTVRPGDTLGEIAKELLGSSRKYADIFEVNRDQLRSPNDVRAGMVLEDPRS